MTGNFDFFTTIHSDNADLTPFWEVSESEFIQGEIAYALWQYDCAINASDSDWEVHFGQLQRELREAEDTLIRYGVDIRKALAL